MTQRTAANGRFIIPKSWPRWSHKCGAHLKRGRPCNKWAAVGMPRCQIHGCGGERNRKLGELRYLAWIIVGVPADMPVEMACKISLRAFSEALINNGRGTVDQQIKAALFITKLLSN